MKLFEIRETQIIFYPKRQTALIGTIVFGAFALILSPALFTDKSSNLGALVVIALMSAAAAVLSHLYGNTEIVIDETSRNVTLKSLFGTKQLVALEDVGQARLTLVQAQYSTNYVATLILKSDPYGQGILLTHALKEKSKQLPIIANQILPRISALLTPDATDTKTAEAHQIEFFSEERRGIYSLKQKNTIGITIAVVLFALFTYLIVATHTHIIFLLLLLVLIGFLGLSYFNGLKIDTNNRTIEKTVAGRKTTIHFSEITDIQTVRHLANGAYTATEVLAITNRSEKPYELSLHFIKDTQKVALFVKNMETLIKNANQ